MSSLFPYVVRRVEWRDACNELRAVRTQVFVDEQKVPVELEWDDMDQVSMYWRIPLKVSPSEPVDCFQMDTSVVWRSCRDGDVAGSAVDYCGNSCGWHTKRASQRSV